MEELVQDFVCALDESDIRIGQEGLSEASATSPKYERERKKRTRKKRTISTSLQFVNPGNSLSKVSHLSDASSSSLDDNYKDTQLFKSNFTHYSADSDEILSCCGHKNHSNFTSSQRDHCYQHRKHKQPVLVESDSYTENGAIPLNISRKIRRKKIKKMNVEPHDDLLLHHKHFTKFDKSNTKYRLKPIDHFKIDKSTNGLQPTMNGDKFATIKRADDSFSGSSSENDSINDDCGQLGDDEMTDYFHEPQSGDSVCGIPYRVFPYACSRGLYLRLSQCHSQVLDESMDTSLVENKLREIYGSQAISETIKGYHSRINRLPGLAARSIRRARRRPKLKKPHQGGCSNDKIELENAELKAIKTKRRKMDNNDSFDLMDELFKASSSLEKREALHNTNRMGSTKKRNNSGSKTK